MIDMELSILYITILSVMGIVMTPYPREGSVWRDAVQLLLIAGFYVSVQYTGLHA